MNTSTIAHVYDRFLNIIAK